ncbi:hypothetical protein BDZ45DRAFT_584922 [Acephala macrosclerotiorum]|nr:hypothetical protein BDZ45DRAFT_584922 [Acephala macrosclerotiorum]
MNTVEDAPEGYPRFSAFIGAHSSFCICRRFSMVRARLLLLKQDRVSVLEAQLEKVDCEETKFLFLGNARRDKNEKRKAVLTQLDVALADYDDFVKRCREVLEAPEAKAHHVKSIQTWVNGTACLSREETAFLAQKQDLMAVARPVDSVLSRVQVILFIMIRPLWPTLRSSHFNVSRDPNVFIPSSPLGRRVGQSILASFATVVLTIPVIIINLLDSSGARLGMAVAASALFVFMLSFLMHAQTKELFLAGATYAAILVVFIAGNNGGA